MNAKLEDREIIGKDQDNNLWKITLERLPTKSNRYKLSIFFNTKQYVITRYQTARAAFDGWELLESLNKKKKEITNE